MRDRAGPPAARPRDGPTARRATGRAAPSGASSRGPPARSRRRSLQPCSSARELLDEPVEPVLELPLDAVDRQRRVDDGNPLRVPLGELEIGGAHALEELRVLALEAIVIARGDARAADVDRRVEQQRQVGLEPALDARTQALEEPAVDSAPAALVCERRVREAVADDPVAPLEGGHDHARKVLRARREHQERLGLRYDRLLVLAVQQKLAQPLAEERPAGLAREQRANAPRSEAALDRREARRLADPFDALDRDECAPHRRALSYAPRSAVRGSG